MEANLAAVLFVSWVVFPFLFDVLGFGVWWQTSLFNIFFVLSGLGLKMLWEVFT